ncbi:MAG: hypothetical protein K8823_966 [Cenarchaeum symbiont of Oopsacas minuta]|nr:hypothetical protein [Cenarchaeum symbiont of Oopsacas minuta]
MMNVEDFIILVMSTITALLTYILKKHGDSEQMKRELSSIMYSEIAYNKNLVIRHIQFDKLDVITYFHTNVYDGVVSSTNIRYFSNELQEQLHDLYHDIKLNNDNCKSKLTPVNLELIIMCEVHQKLRTKAKHFFLRMFQTKYSQTYGS